MNYPFSSFPYFQVFLRILILLVGALIISFAIMGFLALDQAASEAGQKLPPGLTESQIRVFGNPLQAGLLHIFQIIDYATHLPDACWTRQWLNDYQRLRCSLDWEFLGKKAWIITIPILSPLLISWFVWSEVRAFYKKAQKKISQGNASSLGTYTTTAELPFLLFLRPFCWFFALRSIRFYSSQLGEILVYIPHGAPNPISQQQYAIFDMGHFWGKKRYVAILHAPHMAILSS